VELRDLPGSAQRVLDAFVLQLETQGLSLPERRYVAPGTIDVWDGEQMVVYLAHILQGEPGVPTMATPIPPQARHLHGQWAIVLVRAVAIMEREGPVAGQIPGPESLAEGGAATMADAAELVMAAAALHARYALTAPGQGFSIDGCTPEGPQGGLVGTRLLISLSLH
jgi:hypothetical protein